MMKTAKDLQNAYKLHGASHTQNIRNVLPVRSIIMKYIPELPNPDNTFHVQALGSVFSINIKVQSIFKQILEQSTLPTANEIIANANNDGWIVRESTFRATLAIMKKQGLIQSTALPGCSNDSRGKMPHFYYKVV